MIYIGNYDVNNHGKWVVPYALDRPIMTLAIYIADYTLDEEPKDYERIGYVRPSDSESGGGLIYDGLGKAGPASRSAYVKKSDKYPPGHTKRYATPMQPEHMLLSTRDADRMREDIATLKKDLADLAKVVADLTRAMPAITEPRCPKCGAQVDERWDCCEVLDKGASRSPSEPMTFYDHAFIAAYIAANETMNREIATKDAHDVATHLTRNKANQP